MYRLLSALTAVSLLAIAPDVAAQSAGEVPALAGDEAEGEILEEELGSEPPSEADMIAYLEGEGLSTEEATSTARAIREQMSLEASLSFSTGDVAIADSRATLSVPEDFGYLSPEDAGKVLVAWGNPPGGGGDGMLVPMKTGIFDEAGWAVILSYEDEGHISDEDAGEIDYAQMLTEMQEGTEASNSDRVAAGYTAIHLDGWAEPPHYDAVAKKLYWAKLLSDDGGGRSLNYDVRVLGRTGVLSMSAVAPVEQLAQVKSDMERVLTFAEFNDGHRYAQFDPSVDKLAAYGIGALVAGKVAAKVGFFKGMIAMLIAGKKFVVIGLIAAAAALKNLFSRKGDG